MKYSGPPVTAAPEELVVAKLFKKYPIFHGIQKVFPIFTRSHNRQMNLDYFPHL
jgi:hypothetical protein